MYATGFLEENKEYFEPSETAEELGWPIYPIHEEKIISGLKKLICLQEYFWRRNQNYFQKRDWDQENNIGTSSTLNAPEDAGNSSTPKTIAKPKREADAGVEEHVLENIAVHLEYAYPLEGFPSISTTWLFEPLKFSYGKINPKLVDPFVIRYLHERNLYNTDDAAAIDQFARDAMKQYPHLAHQTEYESWARDRCQLIIQKFADSWMEWERNGKIDQENKESKSQETSNPSPYAAAMHPAQYSYAQNPSPYAAVHATPYAPPSTYFPPANAHPQPPPQRSAPPAPEARPQPPQAVAPSIESYHEVPVAPPPAVNVPSTVPDKFLSPSPEKESLPTINNHGLPNNTKVQDPQKSGKSFDELSLLTFRCQWEPASIIISKYAGDDAWKRQKKKLNSLFISAQSEFPDELSFEVWVFCGDRLSKKIKKQDAEDDVD
ncbi:hypothetical protein M7I_6673 [Glarea lozoyensis 74030]|uniref:Uncharacterized protein n=1 Tax=Glarea lozoyensis (strain ATCC 74030 / MF5533) TaxID=1104152 RepID=H0EV78_GLAL7|nr:hypothetical protein M7I_6673 [Glarea lozoyensis 74030]